MLSIKRRRQIKLFFIISVILFILILSSLIVGFFPYGLHKRSMKNVVAPKDSLLYMSVVNSNDSIGKIIDSIYAYRLLHDEAMFDFSLILKNINETVTSMKNNENFYVRTFSEYVYSRGASILFWSVDKNNQNNSEIYFMFDIGILPQFVLNTLMRFNNNILSQSGYKVRKIRYGKKIINSIYKDDKNVVFFTVSNGLLIFSKEYRNMVKIIEYLNSKASNLDEVRILNYAKESYKPDLSLYINKERYKSFDYKGNILFEPLKYIGDNASSVYLFTKLYDDRGIVDIYIDYKYGGSDRASMLIH